MRGVGGWLGGKCLTRAKPSNSTSSAYTVLVTLADIFNLFMSYIIARLSQALYMHQDIEHTTPFFSYMRNYILYKVWIYKKCWSAHDKKTSVTSYCYYARTRVIYTSRLALLE
jgi:hypothetical protein